METELLKIEKLHGSEQWLIWKFQMKQILEANGVYDIVRGITKEPVGGEANAVADWKKLDAKARRIISTSVGNQPIMHILNCEKSSEMWSVLENIYQPKSTSSILLLQQRYYSFVKQPTDDMATFISKLLDIVNQLKEQNEAISDSMVIAKIQMSLPPEYNYFHSAWESTSPADRTLEKMKARLMIEESRLKSQGQVETVEALVVKNQQQSSEKKEN